jgi:hypothetical protein
MQSKHGTGGLTMKKNNCRFWRTSTEAWGDFVSSKCGLSIWLTELHPKFNVYMLSRACGGFGLVFMGKPNIKTIKAARLILRHVEG